MWPISKKIKAEQSRELVMLLLGMNSINIAERHLHSRVYFFSVAKKWANLDVYPQITQKESVQAGKMIQQLRVIALAEELS